MNKESYFSVYLQTKPLQQEVREEVPDCGRALQGAAAHCLLPQDGDETGHRAGGEWGRSQTALSDAFYCFHAVSEHMQRDFLNDPYDGGFQHVFVSLP